MKKLLLFCVVGLLGFACTQRELPVPAADTTGMEIQAELVPSILNPQKEYTVTVFVESQKNHQNIDSVKLAIVSENGSELLNIGLYDDGGALKPAYADPVAFDGYFVTKFLWNPASTEKQNVTFEFTAETLDGHEIQSLTESAVSKQNRAPEIIASVIPDSLPAGFDGTKEFVLTVQDEDGAEDLVNLSLQGLQNDKEIFKRNVPVDQIDEAQNRVIYKLAVDSTFAIGMKGEMTFAFQAIDASGLKSEVVQQTVFIENTAPVLGDVVAITKIKRPEPGKMVGFLIQIPVDDLQSLNDIKYVRLTWQKPDGTFSANSPFDLFDNGLPFNEDFSGWNNGYRGDEEAGDGVYSLTAFFDPDQPLGQYELIFYAEDWVGNVSEKITFHINLTE